MSQKAGLCPCVGLGECDCMIIYGAGFVDFMIPNLKDFVFIVLTLVLCSWIVESHVYHSHIFVYN